MSQELYTKTLAQLPSNTIIVPFFRGESMLHPQFDTMMEKLKKFDTVQFATNADFLDDYSQKTILDACSFVSLSLHNYRLPSETDWTKFLLMAKGEGVTTQISTVESTIPQMQKKEFVESWLKHADRVRIYLQHSHKGFGDVELTICDNGEPCPKPFSDMAVYWDGKVGLCNHDWNNGLLLGDLNKQSIMEVWGSQGYHDVRHKHEMGKRRQVQPCRNCDLWSNEAFGELYTNG